MRAALILALAALAGCSKPAPEVRYVAVAVRPELPPECTAAGGPRPVELSGRPDLDERALIAELTRQVTADDRHITGLETRADVCGAGVKAYAARGTTPAAGKERAPRDH